MKSEYKYSLRIRVARWRRFAELGCGGICAQALIGIFVLEGAPLFMCIGFATLFSIVGYCFNRWREYEGKVLF